MAATITAPNVDNYLVGKGRVYFKRDGAPGDILDYPVGNVTEFNMTPNVERLDHFSSMEGVRKKDISPVIEQSLEIEMVMEEWIPSNLGMALMGIPDISDPSNVSIDILSTTAVRGHLRFVGTNDIGPKWTFDFPAVEFVPSEALNPISDEWGTITVSGEALAQDNSFGTATADLSATQAPTNTLLPAISGIAQEDEVLTALPGNWTGSPVFTYQWQKDSGTGFADIADATGSTYMVVTGDIGAEIRVTVTGTNAAGTASANSAPTATVIAA